MLFIGRTREMPVVSIPLAFKVPREKLKMGAGYSIQKDEKAALEEAYAKVKTQLGVKKPIFAILYSSYGYNQAVLLAEAKRFMPETKIYGYTSLLGTMTGDGFHIGGEEGYSVALMGFASDQMTVGVGASDLTEASSAKEAGRLAIVRAIADAGKTATELPKFVFIVSAPFGQGMEEDVVAGVEEVLGPGKVPIMGGVASGNLAYTGGWAMFANDKVYEKGVVVAPVYTNLKVGYIYLAGFEPTEKKGIVTKFEKGQERIIQEIDKKPAGVVLNDWMGGYLKDHLGTSDNIIPLMGLHPLAEKIVETGGYVNWALIYPWWFHPDNSLTVGVSAPVGTELYLLEGNPELLIQRPALTVRLARSRGQITEKEVAGVVMDHCGGTMRAIPQERLSEEVPLVNAATGNKPFIGTFNSGNYGYFAGVGNRYGNMMVSMVVFGNQ